MPTHAAADEQTVEVAGHRLHLKHLNRVLYPSTGTTKADVIRYYVDVAPRLLPLLADRVVVRRRFPDGVETAGFYERNTPVYAPDWLRVVTLPHGSGEVRYPIVGDLGGLVWLAAHSALELHTPQWSVTKSNERGKPRRVVFDLDPGEGAGLAKCAEVALWLRDRLAADGYSCAPVTSGSKGIQLYMPWSARKRIESVEYAKQLAVEAEQAMPALVVSKMTKALRGGKVFVDWSQNNPAKTTICPYSLRARERPWVAAPREWSEIEAGGVLEHLEFEDVLDRLGDRDPMELAH